MTASQQRYGCDVRIYDDGGKTADRYSILPPRWAGPEYRYSDAARSPAWTALAADARPFHPQGFGQHVGADAGPHLGRRIHWDDLPPDVQHFARQEWPQWCPPKPPPLPVLLDGLIEYAERFAELSEEPADGDCRALVRQARETARALVQR